MAQWTYDQAKNVYRAYLQGAFGDKVHAERLAALEAAVPVMVGPATLESLIEETPPEYLPPPSLHLPFDIIFFEFAEAQELALPVKGDVSVGGALLREGKDVPYMLNFFYRKDGELRDGNLTLDKDRLTAQIHDTFFDIHPTENQIFALNTEPATLAAPFSYSEGPLDAHPAWHSLSKLANLAYNLVNYINAHNVRLVRCAETVVRTKTIKKQGKYRVKRTEHEREFYLVTFKDGLLTEPVPAGQTWTASVRWIVRGHHRHLENEERGPYTTWVRPCIKGPPDAPWKEKRYALLAEKLQREERLYRQHLR